MDLSKLTYSKDSPRKTLKKANFLPPAKRETESKPLVNQRYIPQSYSKADGVLSPHLVFVLSGGEKRERDFLSKLIQQREIRSLRVVFMSEKQQGLQPFQMQEMWKEIQSAGKFKAKGQTYHLEDIDKVFLLSDVDEFYEQLKKIFNDNADAEQGQWIVSNPCFEIWLYYCYLNDPKKDLESLESETSAKRSQKLKSLVAKLIHGGIDPRKAFEQMVKGINNSREHYKVDTNSIPVLFATQMHIMAQYLVETMNQNNNEYTNHTEKIAQWRDKMKK
ncbi:MAG: RloB family protein [Bacteroidales bacterium]|nr:RloB family protein [Bacteroidales bacterium]